MRSYFFLFVLHQISTVAMNVWFVLQTKLPFGDIKILWFNPTGNRCNFVKVWPSQSKRVWKRSDCAVNRRTGRLCCLHVVLFIITTPVNYSKYVAFFRSLDDCWWGLQVNHFYCHYWWTGSIQSQAVPGLDPVSFHHWKVLLCICVGAEQHQERLFKCFTYDYNNSCHLWSEE